MIREGFKAIGSRRYVLERGIDLRAFRLGILCLTNPFLGCHSLLQYVSDLHDQAMYDLSDHKHHINRN